MLVSFYKDLSSANVSQSVSRYGCALPFYLYLQKGLAVMKQTHLPKLWCVVAAILFMLTLSGCGLNAPQVKTYLPLSQYEYAYIAPTGSVLGSFGGYSQANLNSVNPRDFIAGQLFKRGIIVVPEINPAQAQKTLVVSYGEGDKRNILVGYALEVTIQLTTADMNKLVAVATAEGYGETESDKIRDAISQAMTALFEPEKINESSSPFSLGRYF
ncbi:hypothetical protein HMPREF9294_1191 [Porphyromonas asaccharolytica PR426713P-I]|nr:hypothetical protein HMPREF9294_1191 [Porphyromonas asaccharolytica PR426713P-I]